MDDYLFPEWRAHNTRVKYPFSDRVTLESDHGVEIPNDIFLDARLYRLGGQERQYISQITVEIDDVIIEISDAASALATATVDKSSVPVEIPIEDTHGRPAGIFIIDTTGFAAISSWALGSYSFTADQTEFVSTVVVPVPDTSAVRGVIVDGELFTGDVFLVGEDGVVLSEDGGYVRVDIIGDPYFKTNLCPSPEGSQSSLVAVRSFLRTINSISPDQYGDYKLTPGGTVVPDSVLRIVPIDGGVKIRVAATQLRSRG